MHALSEHNYVWTTLFAFYSLQLIKCGFPSMEQEKPLHLTWILVTVLMKNIVQIFSKMFNLAAISLSNLQIKLSLLPTYAIQSLLLEIQMVFLLYKGKVYNKIHKLHIVLVQKRGGAIILSLV